ncbi:MAG: hypothetical protein ABW221_10650 [Vicinamibacteria bacterium]
MRVRVGHGRTSHVRDLGQAIFGLIAGGAIIVTSHPVLACTSANCTLLTRTDGPSLARGSFRVDVGWRFVEQDARRYEDAPLAVEGALEAPVLRPRVDFAGGRLLPNFHQEFAARQTALQVDVAYGLTTRLSSVVSVPLRSRYAVDHVFFPAPGVDLHADAGPGPSRQTLAIAGLGDAQIGLRYAVSRAVTGGVAVKLATGATDRVDEYGQIDDPMHQPGTGALGVVGTLQAAGRLGRVDWLLSGSYQTNGTSGRGYRFGDEAIVAAGASRRIAGAWTATLLAKGQHAARNRFDGTDSPSTGATLVSIAPGFRVQLPRSGTLYASAQLPVYRSVNEGQLAARVIVAVGLAAAF